jgi:hypothetical protein
MREGWGGTIAFLLFLILIVLLGGREGLTTALQWALWIGLGLLCLVIAFYLLKAIITAIGQALTYCWRAISSMIRSAAYGFTHPREVARAVLKFLVLWFLWPVFEARIHLKALRSADSVSTKIAEGSRTAIFSAVSIIWVGLLAAVLAMAGTSWGSLVTEWIRDRAYQ